MTAGGGGQSDAPVKAVVIGAGVGGVATAISLRQAGIQVTLLEQTLEALPLVEALWWHPSFDQDPEHELLRSVFSDVALALAEPAE